MQENERAFIQGKKSTYSSMSTYYLLLTNHSDRYIDRGRSYRRQLLALDYWPSSFHILVQVLTIKTSIFFLCSLQKGTLFLVGEGAFKIGERSFISKRGDGRRTLSYTIE